MAYRCNSWWKKLVLHNDHSIINKDFDQVMLIGYTQTLFSIMESRFRLFVEALSNIKHKTAATLPNNLSRIE